MFLYAERKIITKGRQKVLRLVEDILRPIKTWFKSVTVKKSGLPSRNR